MIEPEGIVPSFVAGESAVAASGKDDDGGLRGVTFFGGERGDGGDVGGFGAEGAWGAIGPERLF